MTGYRTARGMFCTVEEVAEIFGVSTATIRNRIKNKKIPAKKIGNAYLINKKELINIKI